MTEKSNVRKLLVEIRELRDNMIFVPDEYKSAFETEIGYLENVVKLLKKFEDEDGTNN